MLKPKCYMQIIYFKELPNDMKMLAVLGRELSNAATYFSLFGNASNLWK